MKLLVAHEYTYVTITHNNNMNMSPVINLCIGNSKFFDII